MSSSGPFWRDTARALLRRAVCRVRGHEPIKVIDKARIETVAISGPGIRVSESHRYCRRCGAIEYVLPPDPAAPHAPRRVRWVG